MADIAISVCARVAAPLIVPILRPVVRPFKHLWEYKSNLESLKTKVQELERESEDVQGFTFDGAEPPGAVKEWQDKVTKISNEVAGFSQRQSMSCCQRFSCCNLKQQYVHRKRVACVLKKDVPQLNEEARESKSVWKYMSNIENLKKEKENLVATRDQRLNSIKDGEEATQDANRWLKEVNETINMILEIIDSSQEIPNCCKRLICQTCHPHRQAVVSKFKDVDRLLQEGRSFKEFSTPTAETKYKKSIGHLEKEVEKLKLETQCEQLSLKVGEPSIRLWQNKVEKIINEILRLDRVYNPERQEEVVRLLKDVAELFEEAKELKNARDSKQISTQLVAEEPWSQSVERLPPFGSRTSIRDAIMNTLWKSGISIAGIYGLGGIGKTTLAKQVAVQAIREKIIDKFVFIEVSQSPDVKKIQEEIGCKLGFSFDGTPATARKLYQQLKNEEKTLLILDNIWEKHDFQSMGIPCEDDHIGLKILMTGRNKEILSNYSTSNFEVHDLKREEAWTLFTTKANIQADSTDPIAIGVAEECGGVPIAIITIATALHDKGASEWRYALRELRRPSSDSFDGIAAKLYQCIAVSYNFLKEKKLKDTFLLCSSLVNSHDASIEDLLRYGVGLGLFNKFNTLEEERDYVCSLVNSLKASSLLVDVADAPRGSMLFHQFPYEERFGMHDVVCAVGRSIAQKIESAAHVIDSIIPRSWKKDNWLLNCTSITLYDVELPESLSLVCQQLRFLYLRPSSNRFYAGIPDEFFAHIPNLEVLHLVGINLHPLATPLGDLLKLQMLCLERCTLHETGIGDLKELEILSFRHCEMDNLPENFFNLTKLRILEFDGEEHRLDLRKLISNFRELEALYLSDVQVVWEVKKWNTGSRDFGGDVSEHLMNLTSLLIKISDAKMLRGLLSPKLERYNIVIGGKYNLSDSELLLSWNIRRNTSRFFGVNHKSNVDEIISRLKGIKQLVLDEVPGIANNLGDFAELEELVVNDNSHIFHIQESVSEVRAFSFLRTLILWRLENLSAICNGPIGVQYFPQLRILDVMKCHKLNYIFLLVSDRVFQNLEEISVSECSHMENIFATSEEVQEIQLSNLRILRLKSLPKLRSLSSNVRIGDHAIISEEDQAFPASLFDKKVHVPNLEKLDISKMENLETIWHNQLSEASFPKLKSLQVEECAMLSILFGSNLYQTFRGMEFLKVDKCDSLAKIIDLHEVNLEERDCTSSTQLRELCTGPQMIFALHKVEVVRCQRLKHLFYAKERAVAADSKLVFLKLTSLTLYELPELEAIYPGRFTVEWPDLKFLMINQCGILKSDEEQKLKGKEAVCMQAQHGSPSVQSGYEVEVGKLGANLLQTLSSMSQNLTRLILDGCDNLEELFPNYGTGMESFNEKKNAVGFPVLEYLEMKHLSNLKALSSGCYIQFPKLQTFQIINCPEMKAFIFDDKIEVPNLEILIISSMDNLEKIWNNQLVEVSIPKFVSITVGKCRKLETLFEWNVYRRCLMKYSRKEHLGTSTQSKELCSTSLSFENLKVFRILECENLRYLFGKKTIDEKEASATTIEFVFIKLIGLVLSKLPQLRTLYPDSYTVEMPVLKKWMLSECWNPGTDEEQQIQQPLFSVEKVFPCLDELIISAKDFMMMWQGQDPEPLFQSFKILHVHDKSGPCRIEDLAQPILRYNGGVSCLQEENLKLLLILPHFETLLVHGFENCITLVPPNASFQNLTSLEVCDCDSLEDMGTFSMAKNLVNLVRLNIQNCKKMVAVLRNHEDSAGDKIVFSNLKSLSLSYLPSLTSFCPLSLPLEFPSLNYFSVNNCLNMKFFCGGNVDTPILDAVMIYQQEDPVKFFWQWEKHFLSSGDNVNLVIRQHIQGEEIDESTYVGTEEGGYDYVGAKTEEGSYCYVGAEEGGDYYEGAYYAGAEEGGAYYPGEEEGGHYYAGEEEGGNYYVGAEDVGAYYYQE